MRTAKFPWPDQSEVDMELGRAGECESTSEPPEEIFEFTVSPGRGRIELDRHTAAQIASILEMKGRVDTPQSRNIGPSVQVVVKKKDNNTPPVEC